MSWFSYIFHLHIIHYLLSYHLSIIYHPHDTTHIIAAPVIANIVFTIIPNESLTIRAPDVVTCFGVAAAAAAAAAAPAVEFVALPLAVAIPEGPNALLPLLPTVTVAKAVAVPPPITLACVTVAVAIPPPPAPVTVFVDVIEDEEAAVERTESAMGMAATTPPETSWAGLFVVARAAALA